MVKITLKFLVSSKANDSKYIYIYIYIYRTGLKAENDLSIFLCFVFVIIVR